METFWKRQNWWCFNLLFQRLTIVKYFSLLDTGKNRSDLEPACFFLSFCRANSQEKYNGGFDSSRKQTILNIRYQLLVFFQNLSFFWRNLENKRGSNYKRWTWTSYFNFFFFFSWRSLNFHIFSISFVCISANCVKL